MRTCYDNSLSRENITMEETMTNTARQYLSAIYIDWRNNYLSYEVFADHNHITPDQAKELITISRKVYETQNPNM